ncbi:hypothetical protein PQI23_13360 [Leucobacter sp. USCH14]|uniref:hypothetical protein n=1 Tax=Leucobacter sp. USCH14 TaxID=3024838 RepID=UPI0030B3AF85
MASWVDTRPGRPAGSYMVGGVEFKAGKAETGNLTAGGRALFAALGIVAAEDAPATAPEVAETGVPEGAVVLDEVGPEVAEHEQAAEEAPADGDAPAPARRRTRGTK